MSVTVIRPELTEEERERQMLEVSKAACALFRKMHSIGKQDHTTVKTCEICGKKFVTASGHAKFCTKCRKAGLKIAQDRYTEKREKRRRAALEKEYAIGRVYECDTCHRKIRVHGSTTRRTCDECLSAYPEGRHRLKNRELLKEEVVTDESA